MPTALDRLLASPSALRALRTIVNAPELPTSCFPAVHCCQSTASRRQYSSASKFPASTVHEEGGEKARTRSGHPGAFRIHGFDQASNVDDPTRPKNSKWLRIDNVEEPEKAALWAEALQYRERVYGLHGIRDIWFGMARRGYNLPTADTAEANVLWATLMKNSQIVIPIQDHAVQLHKDTGHIFPRLYEVCIVHWLPRNPELALEYHHRMVIKLRLKKLPLRQVAQQLRSRLTAKSLEAFMDIYRTSNERDVYDEIVPFLCDNRKFVDARRWHAMCSHRGDLPSPSVASHPIIQLFTAENSVIYTPNNRFVYPSAGGAPRDGNPKYNEELMRRLLGRDTAPVRFEDSFCARMFATRAFPPDSIVKGLAMVGVNEIGPQALLAMSARTEPLTDLPERFKELKEAGIALQGCVFSLALEKFAMEGKFSLVRSILNSDQHPDVFGDEQLQKKLLNFYLEREDHVQAHRTLAILTLFHNDPCTESWNLVLQASIREVVPHRIVQVLQDMRINGVLITKETLVSIKSILRRRQGGRKPGPAIRGNFDDLRFVTRIYITILESGIAHIPPLAWREIIRRYGMLGRFRELRRLIFWLFSWYAPRNGTIFANLPKPPFLDSATEKLRAAFPHWQHHSNIVPWLSTGNAFHPIRQLFPNPFQQALVVWGFRAGLLPNGSLEQSMLSDVASKKHYRHKFLKRGDIKRLHWSIGLQTLVQLRNLGVHVHRHTVIKALQMQFVILFGRGRSLRKENRAMEDNNSISYGEYVREVNRIWGSPLFQEPKLFGQSRMHGSMWHPRLQRRVNRRKWLRLSEILGKGWRKPDLEIVGDVDESDAMSMGVEKLEHTFLAQGKALGADAAPQTQSTSQDAAHDSSVRSIDRLLAASASEQAKGR
ncbi:hypothetical protein K505DRAFT_325781 [Melanomma pulvis-pyrius CBS 109.77]|uniref:Pentatricopeptide repeat domain-containing protein n=1 Tax=Melanomma pulvis-pyrius CBS 109.77 TaxID=1314802 RepID=A0A6A6XAD6_9PLEO|nr:hypothetical protein K505DRAFT_325781 [Melanomma pulvis-pyrius CBS 109.77]